MRSQRQSHAGSVNIPSNFWIGGYNPTSNIVPRTSIPAESGGIAPSGIGTITMAKPVVSSFPTR